MRVSYFFTCFYLIKRGYIRITSTNEGPRLISSITIQKNFLELFHRSSDVQNQIYNRPGCLVITVKAFKKTFFYNDHGYFRYASKSQYLPQLSNILPEGS